MASYADWLRQNNLYAPTSFGGKRMDIDGVFNRKPDPRAGQVAYPPTPPATPLAPSPTPPNPKFAGGGSYTGPVNSNAVAGPYTGPANNINWKAEYNNYAASHPIHAGVPTAGISRPGGTTGPVDPGGIDPKTNLPVGQTPVDPGGIDPVSGQVIRNAAHAARLKAAQHRKDYAARNPNHAGIMIPKVPTGTITR